MIIGDNRFKLHHMNSENMCRKIEASHDIILPGRSQVNVEARVVLPHLRSSGESWMTEGPDQQDDWQLAHSVVSGESEMVPVRLLNITEDPVVIPKGQRIGSLVEVEVPTPSRQENYVSGVEQERVLLDMINRVDNSISAQDKQKLKELLLKYKGAISWNEYDLGYTDLVQHSIPTTEGPPVRQKLRRFPPEHAAIIDKQVDVMLKQGIIEPSVSEWSSNVVIVKKKDVRGPDGNPLPPSFRFCIDFRPLNGRSVQKVVYPLPNTQDCLDSMSGSSWFSTIDLRSGYFQVALNPEDAHKTNFISRTGSWSYKVMPQGLINATATFMRLMNLVLSGLQFEQCVCYLDDILIFSDSLESHFERLEEVLKRLLSAGLKIRPDKCEFLQQKVKFLGYVIQKTGISVDPSKTDVVKNWPTPKNVSEVRSFTGFCNYYSRLLPQYAQTAQPLYDLTKKNASFVWSDECQRAFEKLKCMLTEAPIVGVPRGSGEFILDTDACDRSIGAVVSQMQDGVETVICYGSRTLSKPEINYTTTRKELLAVVYFMTYFRQYLLGKKFLVRTDHSALSYLQRAPNLMGQQARWQEKLGNFSFDIVYRSGARHGNADGCSRIPCSDGREDGHQGVDLCAHIFDNNEAEPEDTELYIQGWDWETLQKTDPDLGEIYAAFQSNPTERPSKKVTLGWSEDGKILSTFWSSLCMRDGVLYRDHSLPNGQILHQILVPKSLRNDVCRLAHCGITGGHLGEDRTREQLKRRCYFPGWSRFLKSFLQACANCAQYYRGKPPRQGGLQPFSVGGPGELVSIDVTGPHTKTKRGNVYILTCQDYFSKWVECFALPNQEAELVARVLVEQVFCRYGFPAKILSDKGSNFESKLFQEMCRVMGVTKLRTSSYRPSCNGLIERFHRCLHAMLTKVMSENQRDWDEHLAYVLSAYRSSVHSTTNFTPNYLVFGRENRTPMDLVFGSPVDERVVDSEHDYVHRMQERMAASYSLVRESMRSSAERRKVKYDAFVRDGVKFQPDQLVYYYYPRKFQGKSFKFQKVYTGPWKIVEQTGPVNYRICKTSARIPGPQSQIVHVDKLKLIHTETGQEESHIPVGENSPVLPTEIEGVRPRRIIIKPKYLTNDYVCNLFSASSKNVGLICHLCPHAPFGSRKLWKGHLFLVHGVKSAKAQEVSPVTSVKNAASIGADRHSVLESMPVLEDISDAEVEGSLMNDRGCAMVASISCDSPTVSDSAKSSEEAPVMNESERLRELDIVATLMRTIKDVGRPNLSMKVVNVMKDKFPELTVERINATFQWTVWLSKLGQGSSVAIPPPGIVTNLHDGTRSDDPDVGGEKLAGTAPKQDEDSRWDPLLSCSSGRDKLGVYRDPADTEGMPRNSSPMDFVNVEGFVDKSILDVVDKEVNLALETMFPELHQVVEEDFDLV